MASSGVVALALLLLCLCAADTQLAPCAEKPGRSCETGTTSGELLLMQLRRAGVHKQAPTEEPSPDASPTPAPDTTSPPEPVDQLTALRGDVELLSSRISALVSMVQEKRICCSDSCGGGTTVTTTVTTTTTTTSTEEATSLCAAFGDPHFITFDGAHTTFVGDWVLWLVKSQAVWIQMISKDSDGKLAGLAIGGPFLQGHIVALHKESHDAPLRLVFDGREILNTTVDEFHVPGVLDAFRTVGWEDNLYNSEILALRTQAKFDVGTWPSRFTGAPEGGLFLLKLPNGVEITFTGVDFISSVVAMTPQAGGQGGYCGNFNGNPDDDAEPVAPSWNRAIGAGLHAVPASKNLFKRPGAALLGISMEGRRSGTARARPGSLLDVEHRLRDCPQQLKEQAALACAHLSDARIRQDCIFDACMSGDLSSVDGAFAADILGEAVNAKGVPTFLGHGECLDAAGRRYRLFGTRLHTDEACTGLLRQLATTTGVRGAQLRRAAKCQVLVEPGTDPTGEIIHGGWGALVQPEGDVGHGLISNTTDDLAWNCWQLN